MQFEHIHFGAGRQGVGGVVPVSCAAGGRVHVVVHGASELSRECTLACRVGAADGGEEGELDFASFSPADTIEQLHRDARDALESAPELLLTTALSPRGVQEQSEFLVAIAQGRRDRGQRTVFVACEEELGEEHERLLEHLQSLGVDVRRCAFYRLCSQDLRYSGRDRRSVVVAEELEWVIEGEADCELLCALARVPGVIFAQHIDQHQRRIRWLASGPRLSLALLAAAEKQPQIAIPSVASESEEWLEWAHAALVPLVRERCPDLDCIESYAQRTRRALLEHSDDGLTALRNMRRSGLRAFMRELQRLIGDPWRAYFETEAPVPAELSRLLYALRTVLSDMESYSDYEPYAWGDTMLFTRDDFRATVAYEALLTDVLPPTRVKELAKNLADRLKEHREDLPGLSG
ncbi:MAG: hypothetical protein ACRDK4_03490 [Solirubrobacteraceae bacterium]